MDLCIVNSATFWNIWAELCSGKPQYIINMIQNPNWNHRGGSLCLLKYHHLFLTGLKNTTANKDLLYFQLCFANNTEMQFPPSESPFCSFSLATMVPTYIFWSNPKRRLPVDSSCSSRWAAPALFRQQLTLGSLLT